MEGSFDGARHGEIDDATGSMGVVNVLDPKVIDHERKEERAVSVAPAESGGNRSCHGVGLGQIRDCESVSAVIALSTKAE